MILVVPLCLLSAIVGTRVSYQDINIFTQIGFVVLVGLASKNAILIVEFAKMRREAGEDRVQAAARRLHVAAPADRDDFAGVHPRGQRPLDPLPRAPGRRCRRTLGITVFSGMLGVTIFGLVLTPVFFVVIDWMWRIQALQIEDRPVAISNGLLWVFTLGLIRFAGSFR